MVRRLLSGLALVGIVFILLSACSGAERSVAQTVEKLATAAETALNRRNLDAVMPYFATESEGANRTGIGETQEALYQFANRLSPNEQVQFHTFSVKSVKVHESHDLARVSYRMHMSVLRNGQIRFGAVIEQNLALVRTPRGWRISGGDQPQLSEVSGQWPPAATATRGH
jgi:hypothetical protein